MEPSDNQPVDESSTPEVPPLEEIEPELSPNDAIRQALGCQDQERP